MKIGLGKKKIQTISASIVYIVIYNIILLMSFNSTFGKWLSVLSLIIIISIIKDTITLYTVKRKIFDLSIVFVWFSYLFHFGQVFINVYLKKYVFMSQNFLVLRNANLTKSTLLFCLNIIQVVVIGIYLSANRVDVNRIESISSSRLSVKQEKILAWILCVISLPLRTSYTISGIEQVQEDTYLKASVEGYSGVYIQFSLFVIVAFVLLLLSYSSEKIKAMLILSAEIIYLIWAMLTGGRIFSVISIIILVFCYHEKVSKISFRNFLIIIFLAMLLLQIMTSITVLRTTNNFNTAAIIDNIVNPNYNFIIRVLEEFGGTVYTVICTLDEVPEYLNYHCGMSYLKAWLLAGFNYNGILDPIRDSVEYTLLLNHRYSYGGSYIGELYYNFGYISYLAALPVGIFVDKIITNFEVNIEQDDYYKASMYVMPLYAVIAWVRGYFDGFTRGTVWALITLWIIGSILKSIKFVKKR